MKNLILLLSLILMTQAAYGSYSSQVWKNTDSDVRLKDNTRQVFIDQILKLKDGCFRFDSGQLESSNDCVTYQKIGAVDQLNDIADVDIVLPADGEVLTYNNSTGNWENKPGGAGAGDVFTDLTTIEENKITLWDDVAKKVKASVASIANGILTGARLLAEGMDFYNIGVQTGDEAVGTGATCVDADKTTVCTATSASDYFEFPLITLDSDESALGALFDYESTAEVTCEVRDSSDNAINSLVLASSSSEKLNAKIPFYNFSGQKKLRCIFASAGTYTIEKLAWTDSPFVAVTLNQDSDIIEAAGNAGQSLTGGVTDVPFILQNGNNNWDGDSYTVPFDGTMILMGGVYLTAASGTTIRLYKNGVLEKISLTGNYSQNNAEKNFGVLLPVKKGEVYSLRVGASATLSNDSQFHYLTIKHTPAGTTKGFANSAELPKNAYGARIQNNGTASIVSQSKDEPIASVTRTATGTVSVVFTSGFFSEPPAIGQVVETTGASSRAMNVSNLTKDGFTALTVNSGTALVDLDFGFTMTRIGDDEKDIPTTIVAPVGVKEDQNYKITQASNALTDRNNEIEFNLGAANISNEGEQLIVASDDPGNTRTIFTAQKSLTVTASFTAPQATAGFHPVIYKNGAELKKGSTVSSANQDGFVSFRFDLDSGDYFAVGMGANAVANIANITEMGFKAEALDSGFIALDKTQVYKYANNKTSSERPVGEWFGCALYEKSYSVTGASSGDYIDTGITKTNETVRNGWRCQASQCVKTDWYLSASDYGYWAFNSTGLRYLYAGSNSESEGFTIQYTKNSECN